jgi:hypothetical protein
MKENVSTGLHPCELVYSIGANGLTYGSDKGICRITGKESEGILFDKWVRDTFTDFGSLKPGAIISNEALFCFDESSEIIARKTGKFYETLEMLYDLEFEKVLNWQKKKKTTDLPTPKDIGYVKIDEGFICYQRFRTYSHIICNGEWYCVTKADKKKIFELICAGAELVCLTDSGQKHIFFKHKPGMWQLDEIFVTPNIELLKFLHTQICELMKLGFSQTEILTGNYISNRVLKAGLQVWRELDGPLKKYRGMRMMDFAGWMLFIDEESKQKIQDSYEKTK